MQIHPYRDTTNDSPLYRIDSIGKSVHSEIQICMVRGQTPHGPLPLYQRIISLLESITK